METIAGIRIPDSALTREATELARATSPGFLLRHAQRTYVFGMLLTAQAGMTVREELGYVAALLHDLGLTERYAGPRRFEVEGAETARDWAHAQGLSEDEAQVVWDAIALHTSVGIAALRGPEAALVQWGAGADVMGMAANQFDSDTVRAVLAELPRDGFGPAFYDLVDTTAARNPGNYAQTWLAATAQRHSDAPLPTSENTLGAEPFQAVDTAW